MNKDLLASIAVFAEMANSKIDLKKIIDEFIICVFTIDNKLSLDSIEIKNGLANHYDFDIPEVIIRSQLSNMEKEGVFIKQKGKYSISLEVRNSKNILLETLKLKRNKQNDLINDLIKYVELRRGKLSEEKKKSLLNCFSEYLFDNNIDEEYSQLVSAFIIKNQKENNYKVELNLIREGITILKGIQYSEDFNDFNGWNDELTLYLDTEHLFNILGFNGVTYKQILLDFYNLIRDINNKTIKKTGSKKIHLKYLEETELEISNFFFIAKKILRGTKSMEPGKTAMETILLNAQKESDIISKESKFFTDLSSLGIYKANPIEIYDFPKFNIENQNLLDKYKDKKSEDELVKILKSFTYINICRKGRNNEPFEKIKHIIVTGDWITRLMSSDFEVKMKNSDFSFATDIYYLTKRFWYKLNKGLGFTSKLPASLDVINKAQIIISNQLKTHVRDRYEKIVDDLNKGEKSEEHVKDYYLRLRSDSSRPEDITDLNIDEKIDLIFSHDDLENFLRDQSALKSKASEREELSRKLKDSKQEYIKLLEIQKQDELNNLEQNCIKLHNVLLALYYFGIVVIYLILIPLIIYSFRTEKDSPLTILGIILLVYSILLTIKYSDFKKKIYNYSFRDYLKRKTDLEKNE